MKQLTTKDIVNKVKREFEDYTFYTKEVFGFQLEIESLMAKVEGYKTSPVIIPTGTVEHNPHKASPYWKEIEILEQEIEVRMKFIQRINDFRDSLNEEDSFLINKVYFDQNRWSYDKLSMETPNSERNLKRKINSICLEYWHSGHFKK